MTNTAPIGSVGMPARLRAALYLRASSKKKAGHGDDFQQRPEIQEERLRRLCEQRGWEVVGVYCDRATGTKESRPELNRLMQDARRAQFNVVAVAAFDRFARSVKHLVTALDEFRHLNIDFFSLRESIDTGSPMGRVTFVLIAAMAELESSLISERTAAAMAFTRLHGSRSGRSIGRQRRVFDRSKAQDMRQAGLSYRQIAGELGISVGTLHSALKEYTACSEKGEPGGPPCD